MDIDKLIEESIFKIEYFKNMVEKTEWKKLSVKEIQTKGKYNAKLSNEILKNIQLYWSDKQNKFNQQLWDIMYSFIHYISSKQWEWKRLVMEKENEGLNADILRFFLHFQKDKHDQRIKKQEEKLIRNKKRLQERK